MQKNGVILLLVLLCVAFLVSCGKKETAEQKQGELVRIETGEGIPQSFLWMNFGYCLLPSVLLRTE